MSTAVVTPRMTVEEFLERPARTDGLQEELLDGEVILSPNAKKRHMSASANVFKLLLPLERHGFVVLGEMACRLSPHSLPNTDAAVVRQDRWDAVDDDDFPREAPALAIEVHSPSNTRQDVLRKVALYLEHGAQQCWVIYPKQRKVVMFFPDGTNEQARENDTIAFYHCVINVKDLFA